MALTRSKTVAFYFIMIALTVGFLYVVLEFVIGKFYFTDTYITSRVAPDSLTGWRPASGDYWLKPPGSFGKHLISVNSLGLRNREITLPKPQGVTRIVLLGDSFTFGEIVRAEDIFPVMLESILNRGIGAGKFEIINAGVPAFGTAQELLQMRRLAAEGVVGDIYVLVGFSNDILDNAGLHYETLEQNVRQPTFALNDSGKLYPKYAPPYTPPKPGARPRTNQRSKIFEVVKNRLETGVQTRPQLLRALAKVGINVKPERMPGIISGWYNDEILKDGIPLMNALMGEIRNEAQKDGGELLVAYIPSAFQVYFDTYTPLLEKTFPGSPVVAAWKSDPERPQTMTGEICNQLGIPFFDLLPTMRAHSGQSLYVAREGHLNAAGHAVVANALAAFILQHLPPNSSAGG